jgi:arginyl-tRNA synthetase
VEAAARRASRIASPFSWRSGRRLPFLLELGNDRPDKRFILPQNGALTSARLFLATQIGQVVRNGLAVLGVVAVEEM